MTKSIECPKCGANNVHEEKRLVIRGTGERIPIWISMWSSPIWIFVAVFIIGAGVTQSLSKQRFLSAIIGTVLGIFIVMVIKKAQQITRSGTITLHKLHCHICDYSWEGYYDK